MRQIAEPLNVEKYSEIPFNVIEHSLKKQLVSIAKSTKNSVNQA